MIESGTLQALVHALSAYEDRPAILAFHKHSVETWSFATLSEEAGRLATGLLQAGLLAGDRVAIYAPNRPEWILACLALLQAGAVPVPLDSQITKDDLAHVIEDSESRWIITIRPLAERLTTIGIDRNRSIVLLDADEHDPRSWRRFRGQPALPAPGANPEDPGLLFYTSGVSGRPKGVPLSHLNLLSNLRALLDVRVYRPDERLLMPLPLHHVYPFMVGLLAPLAQGLPVILPHTLTGPQVLRALREGEATAIVGVPRLYAALYNIIEQRVRQKGRMATWVFHGLLALARHLLQAFGIRFGARLFAPLRRQVAPHLRTMVSGGAPLEPDLAWKLAGLGWLIAGGYGLTETSPILTLTAPGGLHFDTAGKPLPGVQLRIADPAPKTGQGEVQAKGLNVFGGYLHLSVKTAEAFTEDGWFRTGDVGYLDPDGYLHLAGRASSRMTLPGGEKIWPERVEEQLDSAPSIRESGVLAHENRLVAVIVPHAASIEPCELDGLTRTIRTELDTRMNLLPSYCRLTDFVLSVDPLPRTRLGKIQRHKLTALFDACKREADRIPGQARPIPLDLMAPEDRQLLEDPVALRVWTWLSGRFSSVRLTPDTHLSLELGLDSLGWMTLTLELRDQLGIDLPDEAISRMGTVRDLLREAAEAREASGQGIDPMLQLKEPETLLNEQQQRWLAARGPCERGVGAALHILIRVLMRTLFHLEAHHIERIPAQGSWVMTPNHVSLLDPLAIFAALSRESMNRTCWGGWTGIMFRNAVMRLISRSTRVLPIHQGGHPLSNLAFGAAALKRGDNLVWFPEGDRSRDGTLQPFQPGIGAILTACPVPVIPVRIEGTFDALPRGAWWPRRGHIRIFFGEAVAPDELAEDSTGSDRYRRIAEALHDRVAAMHSPSPRSTTKGD